MSKIVNFVLAFIFIFSFNIAPAFARTIAPPASCDNLTPSIRVGDTFVPIGDPEYKSGFLVYHFSYNPADPAENIYINYNLFAAQDCGYVGPTNEHTTITFPSGVSKFSIRFISDTEFQFFNDISNQPIVCSGCDITFFPTAPNPYKTQFILGSSMGSSHFTSPPINVRGSSITPVLIVPGIMGTEIFKQTGQQNEQLWPDISRMLNPFHDDSFMDPLANLSDTSINIGKVIDKKPKLDYTQNLIDDLILQGYSTSTNLFLFPYDWRRDINDVAVTDDPQMKNPSLKQMIDQIASSTGSSKIDVIAHSQGGLVVKSLLADPQYQQYKSKINKLVFVGTPNLGAPMAAKALLYGDSMGVSFSGMGLDPAEVKKISKDMPSVYELLPGSEYFTHTNGYLGTAQALSNVSPILHVTTLGYASTTEFLDKQDLNSSLVASSSAFHSASYDNFDFTSSGIKTYNIVGCQAGTPGKILIKADGDFQIIPTAGDGTVPVFSANNIPGSVTLFALESNHATMLTEDGIRQQIVSLITSGSVSAQGKITPFASDCRFDGISVSSHSPVDLHIYDGLGRHVGPTADGGFDSDIPNVGYNTIGHEHFAFLPAGGNYNVKLIPTSDAKNKDFFNFYSTAVENGQMATTTYYDRVPITPISTAEVSYVSGNNQPFSFTVDGGAILPSAVLDSERSQDLTPPISTSTIAGTMGQPRYYRNNVSVALSAQDPIIDNNASTTSGLLKIQYSLDNSATTTYQSPISVTSEGLHTISFFSTDKAGNNEQAQTISFTIDKTAPETVIQFNPLLKDIQFTGSDNISTTSKITVVDNINDILLTDQAGNTTDIKLKEKNRKVSMQSTIQSLSYNGAAQDVSKNILAFLWTYDKSGNLTKLSQNVAAKKTYVILAVYNGKKTSLVGLDKTGIILKSITGLDLLKVITNKGDLNWSY